MNFSSIKTSLKQQTIKAQTENQGLQYRLTERDEQIHHLTQERRKILTEKSDRHFLKKLTGLQTTQYRERKNIFPHNNRTLNNLNNS